MKQIIFCILFLFASGQPLSGQTNQQPLTKFISPDGTLSLPRGFSGSFEAKGWKMQTASDGAPRFARSTAGIPADTSWDVDFTSGDLHINGDVNAVAIIGRDVYIGGAFTAALGGSASHILRWDGMNWYTLGNGVNGIVYALAVIGTDLYVGGDFSSPSANIARWDGNSWYALGSGTDAIVLTLATDGLNLYAGGVFGVAGGVSANRVARWNGTAWSALGSGANATVAALAVSGSNLYAGGYFSTAGGVTVNQVARWDGTGWHNLGTGLDGNATAMVASGSDIYVAGPFGTAGNVSASGIAKWDGAAWDSLGSGIGGTVYSLAVSGSNLYAGGDFSQAGGSAAYDVAEWNGVSWSALRNGTNGTVKALATSGTNLIAGGLFTVAGADSATRAARWDGSKWSSLGMGVNGFINAIAVSGSDVYVGGSFNAAGGVPANNVAKWDGTKWSPLGSGIPQSFYLGYPYNSSYESWVYCLYVDGFNLYVGGQFDSAGSVPAMSIAKWDGSQWSALGAGLRFPGTGIYATLPGTAYAIVRGGTDLIVGGSFYSPDTGLARWDGASWHDVAGGVNGSVQALLADSGNIYIGGDFHYAGGVSAQHVAMWNGLTWSACGTGTDSAVSSLTIDRGHLYAGGKFTHAGGASARGVAQWNGSGWSAVGNGVSGGFSCGSCIPTYWPPQVSSLAVGRRVLFAGGIFDSAGSTPAKGIAQWNGVTWAALGSGMESWPPTAGFPYQLPPSVNALAVDSGFLYVAGSFPSAGGKTSNNLARWRIPLPSRTVTCTATGGWNLMSVPVNPPDDSVDVLFPDAASSAFGYNGSYVISPAMAMGAGYWLRFSGPAAVDISGIALDSLNIPLETGWNLIGSISDPVAVTSIVSDAPGLTISKFFGYSNGYAVADTLYPGHAYWVESKGNGNLILSAVPLATTRSRIKIAAMSGLPPGPPSVGNVRRTSRVPDRFALVQNYPNPFNPSTVIRYSLAADGIASLKVYDVLGREVATLAGGFQHAGTYAVTWDASAMPGGVYFYRLIAGSFREVRKLLLLR